jgi:hypothetical protein
MNDQELMSFAIARSNDPVIKNKVLRDALDKDLGPRINFEDGGKVDEVIGAYKKYLGMRKGKQRYKVIPFTTFFEEFSRENFDDGGEVIGKPGGVVEEGVEYYGKNVMSGSPAQQLGNLKKTQERFKRIGNAFINQDYNALKSQTRKARMAKGAKDAGGILNQFDTKLINDVVLGKDVKAQNALAKNLGTNRKYMMDTWKEALEVTKTGKSKSISQNQLKKIQMQSNIFDEILNNKNATVKSMAKKFNITEKQAVKESSKLLNNVYMQNVAIGKKGAVNVDSRGYSLIKSWLPDDFKVTDNFLDNFSNIKGLKKTQSENIGTLIRDAFGKGQDPKKYAQALAGLQEYNNLVNSLPEGLKLDLDHPLSKAFLKGSGVSPDQLLNVTPISRNYNRGFKESLSMAYDKALLADTKDTKKIKQIEKLAKDLGVNIGKGSNKKLKFGTTSIAKKTQSGLTEELIQNLNEQNISSTKLNELKKTEEGKKLLKDVFPTGRKLEIPKVDQKVISSLTDAEQTRLASMGGKGCNGNFAPGGPVPNKIRCITKALDRLKNPENLGPGDKLNARKLFQSAGAKKFGNFLRGLGIPGEIIFESAFAIPAFLRGESGKRILGDTLLGFIGAGQSSEEEFLEYAKKKGLSDPTIELISDVNRIVDLGSNITQKEKTGKTTDPTELYNKVNPRGMRNVYKAEVDETNKIFDKYTMDQPQAKQQFNENMFSNAMQLGLDVEDDVQADKDKRIKERIGSGIIQDDITIGNPRGYAQGGLASLKRKI